MQQQRTPRQLTQSIVTLTRTCNGPSGAMLFEYFTPKRLLTAGIVLAAFLTSCCFAAAPTRISRSVKETQEGVTRSPESLAITSVRPSREIANEAETQNSDVKLITCGVERYRLFPKYTSEVKNLELEDLHYLEPILEPLMTSFGVLDLS